MANIRHCIVKEFIISMNNVYGLIAIFVKNLFSMHLQLLELYIIAN